MDKNKVLYLTSTFTKAAAGDSEDSIKNVYIEGYASTNDVDRMGDVVPTSVWEAGMQNYLKNPIILAYHDYDEPCGRMVDHKIDGRGLWVKARISSASKVFELVKDGLLTAFSIGFRVKDAEYNSAAEVFVVKELELLEISVVSVPANQETIFSLAKAFDNAEDYENFKKQFSKEVDGAKEISSASEDESNTPKEFIMDQKEIQKLLEEQVAKALADKEAAEKAAKEAEARKQAEIDARVKAALEAHVKTVDTGAERLLKDIEARLSEKANEQKSLLEGLEASIKEKADELAKLQASKMQFADNKSGTVSYEEKEKAILLSKISGKSLEDTKFGRSLIQKVGQHQPANKTEWETEVSLTMENEVRRRLVMAPLMRNIAMETNVMRIPVNPEAGKATWVQNSEFGTNASSGATAVHQLKDITLNAYKVATREYMAYEEEEDSLLVLMPIVRDAMVRRVARAVDAAMIYGAGTATDPVKGVALYDASSVVTIDSSAKATVANLRSLRKDLGAWGLNPADLVYVVNTEVYYNLLDDETFQTMDKVGAQATLLTGQVGSIANTPVVVSGEFPEIAEGLVTGTTNLAAFCFAPANFLVGNQRGLRIDTAELVEKQSRVLVASLRTGMTQVTANLGPAVSTLRYVNV